MTTINLRDYYPWYIEDQYIEVSDEVAAELRADSNRQSRQRLDRHGTIVVGSCETFHHYNVQGVK